MLVFDFHIHTSESYDSPMKINTLINVSSKKGLNMIAITNHNRINNKMLELALDNPMIIVGEEISTDKGEIIGLFLKKEIKPGDAEKVIEEIKSQDGLVYLPHPFKRSTVVKYSEIIKEVDIIEVWNCRSNYEQNLKALLFAQEKRIPFGCGSDAHFANEIGRCKLIIRDLSIKDIEKETLVDALRRHEYTIIGLNSKYYVYEALSQLLKSLRCKSLKTLKHAFLFPTFEILLNRSRALNVSIEVSAGVCRKINISQFSENKP